jgi:hypothetical protein
MTRERARFVLGCWGSRATSSGCCGAGQRRDQGIALAVGRDTQLSEEALACMLEQMAAAQTGPEMWSALGRLPADQREALLLVRQDELSSKEAAALLGITATTIRTARRDRNATNVLSARIPGLRRLHGRCSSPSRRRSRRMTAPWQTSTLGQSALTIASNPQHARSSRYRGRRDAGRGPLCRSCLPRSVH